MRVNRKLFVGLAPLAIALGLVAPGPVRAGWIQMNGPEPPVVFALGTDGSIRYLGSNESDAGDVYRSLDGGATWTNAGLPNGGVNVIEIHLGKVFVGGYLSGLSFSSDSGQTWTDVTAGLSQFDSVGDLAELSGILFLSKDEFETEPLRRSTDGGVSWSPIPGCPAIRCAFLESFGANLYAGTVGSGVYRSTDGGASWEPASAGLPVGSQVTAMASDGANLFAALDVTGDAGALGVYRSTNAGGVWEKVSVDLPSNLLAYFGALAAADGILYAGLAGSPVLAGVYRSTNGGVNWTLASNGLPAQTDIRALLPDGPALLAGTAAGVHRSTDGGALWTPTGAGTAAIRGVGGLMADEAGLLLGLQTAGGGARGIWRTTDHGDSWARAEEPANSTAQDFLRFGSEIFAAVYGLARGVYRSTDGGLTWTPSSQGIPSNTILHALHESDGILLAGAYEGLYRSTSGGASWITVPGMFEVTCFATFEGMVYAGHYGPGASVSTDGGATWSPVNGGLDSDHARYFHDMVVHDGSLYGATRAGVYRFDGTVWSPAGLQDDLTNTLLPLDGALLAGGGVYGDVWYTLDGGETWFPFEESYTGGEVYELADDGERLILGSRGRALWMRPRSDVPQPAGVGAPAGGREPALRLSSTPNPFTTSTSISYGLRAAGPVRLTLHDLGGRRIRTLVDGAGTAGAHVVRVDGAGLPPGIYFVRLTSPDGVRTGSILRAR